MQPVHMILKSSGQPHLDYCMLLKSPRYSEHGEGAEKIFQKVAQMSVYKLKRDDEEYVFVFSG